MADMTEGSAGLRIVLLGKTGVGKSSTANSLLGEKLFTTSFYGDSDTARCKAENKTVYGREISVIDTPGYFSTECSDEELKPEIAKCITECSPGPHAFLIVLRVTRQTTEEKEVVATIMKTFGEGALKYAVVLFTHGDQLDADVTIQQFVDKNSHLKKLVENCGNRLHVIDNKYWNHHPTEGHGDERSNAVQIKKLLNTIDQMVEQNGGKRYTNEMLEAVTQAIEEETVNISEETGGQLPVSTIKEMAKEKVKRFLIQAAGVSTGALMGALLGAVAGAGAVAVLLAKLCTSPHADVAAAAVLLKTGIGLGAAAGVGACVGGIAGGITGAEAANEAQSPREAVERAFHAVTDPAVDFVMNKIEDTMQTGFKKVSYSPL